MSNSQSPAILELVNLHKVFNQDLFAPKQVAINKLSCRFLKGQCTALMGHNGAGKTTTIRTIFGFIRPTSGEVLFFGKPIKTAHRLAIGYMPEVNKLPRNLTPQECLKTQLKLLAPPEMPGRVMRQKVEEALKHVGLWGHHTKRVEQLSKGMGRRLAYAMATIHEPELIILDEPFSGLDPLGRQRLVEFIRDLKAKGKSIILCTHELWSLGNLCDQLHVLNRGSLVYSTLDASSLGEPQSRQQFYELAISGCPETQLRDIKSSRTLPPWSGLEQEGFLTVLKFSSYADSASWLKSCLDLGLVVTRFNLRSSLDESSLVPFFQGGND